MPNTEQSDTLPPVAKTVLWDDLSFLEKVTSVVPSSVFVYNRSTRLVEYSNRSWGAGLGYSPQEMAEFGSDMLPILTHPDDLPDLVAQFEMDDTISNDDIVSQQYRMLHKDGSWRWFQAHAAVFDRDEQGEIARMLGTSAEITAQKKAEAQIFAERKAAIAAMTKLRSYVDGTSKALSEPASQLLTQFEKLLTQFPDQFEDDAQRALRQGHDIVTRMNSFVQDAQSYSRMLVSLQTFERVALQELVESIVLSLAEEIAQADAIVDVGDLPDVNGDAAQLETLFRRLITSAVKHRRADTALIVVVSETTPAGSDRVEISVTDNGKSAPLRQVERDDKMFKKVLLENAPTGAALAPAICQRIAMNHDSAIHVRSFPSKKVAYSLLLDRAE